MSMTWFIVHVVQAHTDISSNFSTILVLLIFSVGITGG